MECVDDDEFRISNAEGKTLNKQGTISQTWSQYIQNKQTNMHVLIPFFADLEKVVVVVLVNHLVYNLDLGSHLS